MSDHESAHTSQITTNPLPSNHLQAMSDYTIVTKYARYNDKSGRRETWNEMVDRVRDMHLFRYGTRGVNEEINWAFEQVRQRKVLPSMRSLQYGGEAIIANDARIYNCSYSLADRSRFFSECLWLLLSGTGTGFSVQKQHVAKLPELVNAVDSTEKEIMTYTVGDTIEGWADALQVLMDSYFKGTPLSNKEIFFDFTRIRRKGAKIRTSGGRAPGPKPLQKALKRIKRILIDAVENGQSKLRPIQVYDIVTMAADCVLAGGIRKCIAKGSKVITKNGYKNIEDIKKNDIVSTNNGWREVKDTFIQGKQDIVRLYHQDGYIDCTDKHRIAVLKDAYGNHEWKMVKDLNKGDLLYFVRNMAEGTETNMPFFDYERPPNSTTCKDIIIPELDDDMAWFIGVLHGDGYVRLTDSSGSVVIAVAPDMPEMAIKIEEIIKRFGINCKTHFPTELDNLFRIKVKSKQLAYYLHTNFKQPNTSMNIPACIVNGMPSIRAAYLQGLLDSDGCIKNRPQLMVLSIYEDFIKQVQNLFYSLGICTRLNTKPNGEWKQQYSLSIINKEDKKLFNILSNNIGYKVINETKSNGNSNRFPFEMFDYDKYHGKDRRTFCLKNKYITSDAISNLEDDYKIVPMEFSHIEPIGEKETYDLEVDDDHCFICEGVLVHNSATISIFSPDDEEMMQSKVGFYQQIKILTDKRKDGSWLTDVGIAYEIKKLDGEEPIKGDICDIGWYNLYPWRQLSNNSVALLRDKCEFSDFENIINCAKSYGEPGFIFLDNLDYGYNPCVEISLNPVDPKTNQTGWGVCNLTEINGGAIRNKDDFKNAVKAATIIGTLQAGYTYLNYLSDASRNIIRRESLLGVSVTGWMDNPEFLLNPELQTEMALYAIEVNKEMAQKIDINPAARVTCTKPAGSTSVVLGTGSGIHPHHARHYFRRVRMNRNEKPAQYFKLHNPHMVEPSLSNEYDDVITFCVQVPESAVIKKDVSAIDFLKMVKNTYENWVVPGTADPDSSPGLTHNVSNTVTVKADEWDEVCKFIYENRKCFSGISMLADFGDKVYKQAPMEKVESKEDIEKWNELITNYHPVDWELFKETEDFTEMQAIVACSGGSCDLMF